jgi:tetratricopeptide (TPR) repeat protein
MDSSSARLFQGRGMLYQNIDSYGKALCDFNTSIELDGDNPELYRLRGKIKIKMGDESGAEKDQNSARELEEAQRNGFSRDLKELDQYLRRGLQKMDKGDYDGALRDFGVVLEIEPHHVEAYMSRGAIHQAQGNYDAARKDFKKAKECRERG